VIERVFYPDESELGIAVFRHGRGPEPVWFIHGLGMHHGFWLGALEYFDTARYTLYFVDLPGFGNGAKFADGGYEMADFAERMLRLLGQLHVDGAHWVAHSMGGIVALLMTDSPTFNPWSLTLAEGNLVETDAFMSSKIASRTERRFVEHYDAWCSILPTFMRDESDALKARYSASLGATSAIAMYRASVSCAKWSRSNTLPERFARLDCPRAYVAGEKSLGRRPLPEVVRAPCVDLLTIEGQGHFMMDDPARFFPALARFIGKNARPAR
jgi:pimeloyl-ACP methyl ester carboxylesterase